MASKNSYLDYLAQVPLFANFGPKDLQKIAKASDEITVPPGTVIVDQGQAGKEAFIVISGTALVSRNKRKVASLGAGAIIGELALLDRGPRTATVTAETELTLLVIDQRNFAGVIDTVPTLARKLLSSLAARIRELDRQTYG